MYRPSLGWAAESAAPDLLGDLLQEPPPLRFPDDHLAIDAHNDRVVDHSVIVVAPIARVPAFDAGLGARFAEEESHAPRVRTDRELNQEDRSSWLRSHAARNPRTSVGLRNVIY